MRPAQSGDGTPQHTWRCRELRMSAAGSWPPCTARQSILPSTASQPSCRASCGRGKCLPAPLAVLLHCMCAVLGCAGLLGTMTAACTSQLVWSSSPPIHPLMRCRAYPDFMSKKDKSTYTSEKVRLLGAGVANGGAGQPGQPFRLCRLQQPPAAGASADQPAGLRLTLPSLLTASLLQVLGRMYRAVQQAAREARKAVKLLAREGGSAAEGGAAGGSAVGGSAAVPAEERQLFEFPGFMEEVEAALVSRTAPAVQRRCAPCVGQAPAATCSACPAMHPHADAGAALLALPLHAHRIRTKQLPLHPR